MMGLRKLYDTDSGNSICGFDKHHFSKAILLSYTRGYIVYRDLIAVHQIEDSIIASENHGLRTMPYRGKNITPCVKKLPESYCHLMVYKFNTWIDLLSQNKVVAGAILDLIIDGKSFVYVDRRFRKANGWARKNLVAGLSLWSVNHD